MPEGSVIQLKFKSSSTSKKNDNHPLKGVREKEGNSTKTSSSGTTFVDLTGDDSSSSNYDNLDRFATPMRVHDMQRISFNVKKLSDFCMTSKELLTNAALSNSVCISILYFL